jgi:hypothetical protein
VTSIVQSIASGKQAGSAPPTPSNVDNNRSSTNTFDTLNQDLAFLREQATRQNDQQQQTQMDSLQHTRRMEEERRQDSKRHHQRHDFVRGKTEQLSIDEYDIRMEQDDEEAEQRRLEKQQREMENSFRQVRKKKKIRKS